MIWFRVALIRPWLEFSSFAWSEHNWRKSTSNSKLEKTVNMDSCYISLVFCCNLWRHSKPVSEVKESFYNRIKPRHLFESKSLDVSELFNSCNRDSWAELLLAFSGFLFERLNLGFIFYFNTLGTQSREFRLLSLWDLFPRFDDYWTHLKMQRECCYQSRRSSKNAWLYKDVFYGKVRLVVLQKYDFSFIFYRFSDWILQMQIVFLHMSSNDA